ncbi:P pilus assembly chaperone PapD [Polynucleobacter sphagniphilus]|jgi:P pilus assembly chaperone PapD|uniref:hypothetical protein n=1 Tax=Polynucleobacter sphagniphilus TaxID=1743169 RepID=UPI002474A5D3|nr:hypothetical protein [Polynucleobacter sphagniphilus]MDH6250206.1 P pilus assembly chaperone PapD [Polynucleobacter sphagniphilus]
MKQIFICLLLLISFNSYGEIQNLSCNVVGKLYVKGGGFSKIDPEKTNITVQVEKKNNDIYITNSSPYLYRFSVVSSSDNELGIISKNLTTANQYFIQTESIENKIKNTLTLNRISGDLSVQSEMSDTGNLLDITGKCELVKNRQKF